MYLLLTFIRFVYYRTHQPAAVSDSIVSSQKALDFSQLFVGSNHLLELLEQLKVA
jgi:hypothetical protein